MTPMRIRSRRVRKESAVAGFAPAVAQLATVGLVAGLLLSARPRVSRRRCLGTGHRPRRPGPGRQARGRCVDLLVIGIDGNGQGKKDTPGQVSPRSPTSSGAKATEAGPQVIGSSGSRSPPRCGRDTAHPEAAPVPARSAVPA